MWWGKLGHVQAPEREWITSHREHMAEEIPNDDDMPGINELDESMMEMAASEREILESVFADLDDFEEKRKNA
jgi:hypothetical protein